MITPEQTLAVMTRSAGAVVALLCPRCKMVRAPRPGKRVCGPCADELERQWQEATGEAEVGGV